MSESSKVDQALSHPRSGNATNSGGGGRGRGRGGGRGGAGGGGGRNSGGRGGGGGGGRGRGGGGGSGGGRGRGGGSSGRGRGGDGVGVNGQQRENNNRTPRDEEGRSEPKDSMMADEANGSNNPKKHRHGPNNNAAPSKRRKDKPKGENSNDDPTMMKADQIDSKDGGEGGGDNSSPNASKLAHITDHKFSDLDISASIRRSLAEIFKYELMTVVQSETLPLILKGEDCLAKAKTGTGKTLAFMIPTIERMTNRKDSSPTDIFCLVISPTRELAQQIATETEKLLTFQPKNLQKVVVCVGGTNIKDDFKRLKGTTPIVVATPGRLLDHLQNHGLAERMASLDSLIFDEADQLLDMGFRPDIERILRLLDPSKKSRQTLLFSATIPASVSEVASIALRPTYSFVDTVGEDSEQTHLHVQQQLIVTPQEKQMLALTSILDRETSQKPYKIIVFFTTARLTGFMAEAFNAVSNLSGFKVLEIHSRKSQKQRDRASEEFREAKNAVMFSSDVSARGMDYPDVSFVLQVGLTDRAQYIHRLGRTARAGKEGKGALLLAAYEEHYMVQRELGDMPLETTSIPETEKITKIVDQALQKVGRDEGLRQSAEQAYRAWLGYYNGHLKKVKWDKQQLVVQANMWAKENGLKDQPSLQKKTIGKMGLKGVPGLKIEN